MLSHRPYTYNMAMYPLDLMLLVLLLLLLGLICLKFFCKSHVGYLHLVRTPVRCCFSILRISSVYETAYALCTRVLIMHIYELFALKTYVPETLTMDVHNLPQCQQTTISRPSPE